MTYATQQLRDEHEGIDVAIAVLDRLAEQHLSEDEHADLVEGFERVEQERIGPGVHERYHALLDRLQAKYL